MLTDTAIKTAIIKALTTDTYDATNNEIKASLSVGQNIEVQARRISRLCDEMVREGKLTCRDTVNYMWGFKVGHYSVVRS